MTKEQPSRKSVDAPLVKQAQRELPYATVAYTELMRRYETRLHRYCTRFLGDAAEAEDACQEVFLRVFHTLGGFEGRSAFRTWLFSIAHNICATRYQQRARQREVMDEYGDYARLSQSAPAEERSDLNALLDQLPEADREILSLRLVAGLSLDEIAQVVGMKLSATKMRLYRAVEKVSELNRKENDHPPV